MSRKQVTQIFDDLDGEEVDPADVVVVEFTHKGIQYSMDLRESNADKFDADMEQWTPRAHRVGGTKTVRSRPVITTDNAPKKGAKGRHNAETLKAIREWAGSNGYEVSDRGRIPVEVVDAWEAAH